MSTPSLTRSAMDRIVDQHFVFEATDDIDGVLATLVDDVEHDVVGSPMGPLRGRASARDFYERMFADLAQDDVTSLRRYYGDEFVVDESLWRGRAVGNPLGLPGNGRPLEFRILHVFEFDPDGSIARENVWMDTSAIAAQLPANDGTAPAATVGAKDVVVEFYREFDRGALAGFAGLDASFTATVFGSTVLDRDGFIDFGRSFLAAFSNGRHEFDAVVAERDNVATIGHYCGVHDGPLMGVEPTGREVRFAVMHLDRVLDGRIVDHVGLGDIATMWEQLGVDAPVAG